MRVRETRPDGEVRETDQVLYGALRGDRLRYPAERRKFANAIAERDKGSRAAASTIIAITF